MCRVSLSSSMVWAITWYWFSESSVLRVSILLANCNITQSSLAEMSVGREKPSPAGPFCRIGREPPSPLREEDLQLPCLIGGIVISGNPWAWLRLFSQWCTFDLCIDSTVSSKALMSFLVIRQHLHLRAATVRWPQTISPEWKSTAWQMRFPMILESIVPSGRCFCHLEKGHILAAPDFHFTPTRNWEIL